MSLKYCLKKSLALLLSGAALSANASELTEQTDALASLKSLRSSFGTSVFQGRSENGENCTVTAEYLPSSLRGRRPMTFAVSVGSAKFSLDPNSGRFNLAKASGSVVIASKSKTFLEYTKANNQLVEIEFNTMSAPSSVRVKESIRRLGVSTTTNEKKCMNLTAVESVPHPKQDPEKVTMTCLLVGTDSSKIVAKKLWSKEDSDFFLLRQNELEYLFMTSQLGGRAEHWLDSQAMRHLFVNGDEITAHINGVYFEGTCRPAK